MNDHFFLRLGPKGVPLLREVWDDYLAGTDVLNDIPGEKECRRRLFPTQAWFEKFPELAKAHLSDSQIAVEVKRIRKKKRIFGPACRDAGLSMRQVYAAVLKWQDLFLQPGGEFHWFFDRMRLGYRVGSFMFIHAGFDDPIAKQVRKYGIKAVNRDFRQALKGEPFDLYYGSLANTVRTKYRDVDRPLSPKGADHIRDSGVHAIIHGHRNLLDGQRIMLRRGLINFECDATVDERSRVKEGLKGPGAAVTIIDPEGFVMGISTDYPFAKVFEPKRTLKAMRTILRKAGP